jgi:hypothetical protein
VSEEEVFELELWGGATERRYRAARSDVEAMPWGTLTNIPKDIADDARRNWTVAAFQEHRTGAQCAQALEALFVCKAPVDIIAGFARFPLDEVVHVELAARMADELGGAVELVHTRADVVRPASAREPLLAAAELVVRTFCVGEALSIPLLHAAWQAARYPLARAVLARIVRDEAAHGIAGFVFLDWAAPFFGDAERAHLSRVASDAVAELHKLWAPIRTRAKTPLTHANGLGWIGDDAYLTLAERSLADKVIAPLARRGINATHPATT